MRYEFVEYLHYWGPTWKKKTEDAISEFAKVNNAEVVSMTTIQTTAVPYPTLYVLFKINGA